MQDAFERAQNFAHWGRRAAELLIESYPIERRPVGEQVIAAADRSAGRRRCVEAVSAPVPPT